MSKVTFGKFPKLTNGNPCDGSKIHLGDVLVGYIEREIDWTDIGSLQPYYKAKITGYKLALHDNTDRVDQVFGSLAEARNEARKIFAGK